MVLAVASKTCATSNHNGGTWGNASDICMSPLNVVMLDLGPLVLQRPWKCKGVHRSVTHIPAFNWSHPCCRVPVPEAAQLSKSGRACAVLTLASCGRPCKISCRNPHMRQQSLYDRWTYKFSHAFKLPSTSPMIIGPPGTPMFRSNFAEKVYLRTMGNWVGMEQFQGQIALLIPTKIDHQGRPRMTKSWIQPIWQFVETQV